MLTEKQITELAKRAGIKSEDLLKVYKSEKEEDLKLETEGEFITHAELEEIKEKKGAESYKEGKKAGEEMVIKEIRTDEKLEFEGKTKENLVKALKDKVMKESGTKPAERITELENDNKKLKDLVTETEAKLQTETEKFNSKLEDIEIESFVKSKLPDKLENGLTREELHILYRAKKTLAKTETGISLIDPATKQVIKDKKLNPISVDDDIKTFLEPFGKPAEPGRGAGDDKTKHKTNIESFTKRSEVDEYCEKNDIHLSERSGILSKAMKNEGFEINK
jgi:hypothetical protein